MTGSDLPRGDSDPPVDAPAAGEVTSSGSVWRLVLDVFFQNRLAIVGLGMIVFMTGFCFIGPLVYHTDQIHTDLLEATQPPSLAHPLGTDDVGRDVLGRLMLGGQSSLEVALAAALLATGFGALWGAVAGLAGGAVDTLMMRIVDGLLAIPALFLLLFVATIFTPHLAVMIAVVALVSWLVPARLVRGETLTLRSLDYVQAVRVMGGGSTRVVLRHIVPNAIGTIVVNATFQVADAILIVATLSYLGLGVPPPAANWGGMLSNGITYTYDGYWWLIYPAGLAIVITVVAFNFVGDALRDAVNARLQTR